MNVKASPQAWIFAGLFLVSGSAGLMYEIAWERLLALHFGVTMVSVTLIVAAYMAGMGIGSLAGGYLSRRGTRTLLIYSAVEMAIALFGLASPWLIDMVGSRLAGSSYSLVFLVSFGVLLVPTTLMGMTLPLLTQSFVRKVATSGSVIGLFYGINTLGAALGAIIAAYGLIGHFGFGGTIFIAAGLNAGVGLLALLMARAPLRSRSGGGRSAPRTIRGTPTTWSPAAILAAAFLVGFVSLGFEMLWIRILLILNKNTAYGFASILFVYLIGLAIGGYLFGRLADRSPDPALLFSRIEVGGATLAVVCFLAFWLTLRLDPPWIRDFFESQKPALPFIKVHGELLFSRRMLVSALWEYFLPILLLAFPASLVLGGGLTVLDRLAIHAPEFAGRRVGEVHLANILGSVAGTLAISFVGLPVIGSEWTLKSLALLTLAFPLYYHLDNARRSQPSNHFPVTLALAGILVVSILAVPGKGRFYAQLFSLGSGQDARISESGDSVLALTTTARDQGDSGLFWIGGEVNSFFPPSSVYENRALACAGATKPERILVIGFGGGFTSLFFQSQPDVQEIVVVELLGDIAPFLRENLESARATLVDGRVGYIVDDGRRYLNANPDETFDLIAIDPLREHTAGHNNLYSEQAMTIYLAHLKPGGVLCAWMQEFHVVPNTAARIFPYVHEYSNEVLIASNQPLAYDIEYMDSLAARYRAHVDRFYPAGLENYPSSQSALSGLARDRDQILAEEASTPYLTDLTPWLEYYLFRRPAR